MGIVEIFLLGVGLSMDAFAVSICKGLTLRKRDLTKALVAGAWFGVFQALMPTLGYFCGQKMARLVEDFDHWVVFLLLGAIGINMIISSQKSNDDVDPSFGFVNMLLLAIATSIDALAVGLSFAFMKTRLLPAVIIIGCTTFVLSTIGVQVGSTFGSRYRSRAEWFGGLVLIFIGTKILIEHLFF